MTAPAATRQQASPAPPRRRGGAAFLLSSALVHLGNYSYNVVMGRALGPALYSDLAVIVTLLLVVTLAAGTLQTAAAKEATRGGGQFWLRRWAGGAGLAAAALLALAAPLLSSFFHTSSPWPFAIFGIGLPAYFVQAVDRGYLQGATSFGRLALSYQAEMWARLGGAVLLVWAGLGVEGAVAALSLSFVASWAVARPRRLPTAGSPRRIGAVAGAAAVLAAGEVLINHSDLLIVKHFSDPIVAGGYGALAVVGRVPFFIAWSIAAVAFPYVARRHRRAWGVGVGAVAALGLAATAVGAGAPGLIVSTLFGPAFSAYAPLLGWYLLATSLFAVAHAIALFGIAVDRGGAALIVLGGGVVQTVTLWLFHGSIAVVVGVQVATMAALTAAVIWWWRRRGR